MMTDITIHTTMFLVRQLQASLQIQQHIEQLELGISQLLTGKLLPSLIPIAAIINNIEHTLANTKADLRVPHRQCHYYQHAKFTFGKTGISMYINIAIPISSTPVLQAYKIDVYPVNIPTS